MTSKAKTVCLLSVLTGGRRSLGFLAPPIRHAAVTTCTTTSSRTLSNTGSSRTSLCGYLDDLSSAEHQPEPAKKPSPPMKKRSGGIPSGRGPEASYLDMMTGAAGAAKSDDQQTGGHDDAIPTSDDDTNKTPVSSWSGLYLTDLLHPMDGGGDDSRTDIRNLLTQRSIQSFTRLLEECRDPHSAKWIQEDFLDTGNLLEYHGTGAGFIERYGGLWDAPLLDMLNQPPDRIIVSAKRRGRGHGGWSKHNPYLKERWVEIPVDIDPPSLAGRILQVREQIAREWVDDLDVVVLANGRILDSYFAHVKAGREEEAKGGTVGSCDDVAFDRTAVNLANDNSRFATTASSPFVRGNFDLLYNLCTQAAIHRILREHRARGRHERNSVDFAFLRDFYTDRAAEYFDGDLPYGRADDFIDELLQTTPAILSAKDGSRTGLVDPLGTAESIIRMRNDVALEWKAMMGHVQEDHTGIRQALLDHSWEGSESRADDSTTFE